MDRRLGVLAALLLGVGACGKDEPAGDGWQRFAAPSTLVTPEFVDATGFNPDHKKEYGVTYGFFTDEQLARLPHEVRDLLTPAPEEPITKEMYEGYHDYRALTEELQRLVDTYPHLARLKTAGRSVQGREIWYLILSDRPDEDEHEPKFIYHANMHGDEVVGRELMIYLARHLLAEYGKDQRITQLLDHSQIFIMPSMNPDGFELGRRGNSRGYDLNRNFPDRFRSPRDTGDGRQIEVQHMMRLAAENHFVYGINWHGGEICFNLPWGNIRNLPENKHGDDAMFYPIGREYTEFNRPMYANHRRNFDHGLTYGYEWYPVNGGINDWFNGYRRSLHAVVELSVTKWPRSSELSRFWDDNREAMLTYLWRGLRGVHLEIRGLEGEIVREPVIQVASAPRRPLQFDDGYVHRLTGDGPQTVTIEAPGYAAKTIETEAVYFDGNFVQVTLERQ